jgi:DNA-directed RNA polymerase subunit RPC12/RpoP
MHITTLIGTMSKVKCTGCGRELEEWDGEHEGDEIWIAPKNDNNGGEDILCEGCYVKRLRK